jgi:hypothetical protein
LQQKAAMGKSPHDSVLPITTSDGCVVKLFNARLFDEMIIGCGYVYTIPKFIFAYRGSNPAAITTPMRWWLDMPLEQ